MRYNIRRPERTVWASASTLDEAVKEQERALRVTGLPHLIYDRDTGFVVRGARGIACAADAQARKNRAKLTETDQ
jgi:hypothetical protein